MGDERPADTLPPDVAALAELLGERMGLGKGEQGGLELRFGPEGKLRKWRRLEEGGREGMARFDNEGGSD